MKLKLLRFAIAALFIIGITAGANAQLTLVTSPYTQNFDTIGSGLPTGWTVRTGSTATVLGTTETLATGLIDWGSTNGRFGNSAAAESPATASDNTATQGGRADRAISLKQSGSFGDPGAAWVLNLLNTTGKSSFNLSFKFQQLQAVSSGRTVTFRVDYGLGTSPSTFTKIVTSPDTLTASLASTGPGWSSVNVSAALPSAIDNQSQKVWIRIVTIASSTGSGTRPMAAIDDVSLSWTGGSCTTPGDPTSSDVSACVGSTATITGAGPTTGASYTYWTAATGGSAITSSTTPPGTVSGNDLTVPATLVTGSYDYYVQAENGSCLSTNRKKVTVTVNALPADPANPTAAANPACTSTTLNTMTPAAGTTNYWQGTTTGGTSTASTTASTYNVSSTGTYYVRARNNTTLCWSAGSGSLAVTVNTTPGQPSTVVQSPTGSICMGNSYTFSVTNTAGVNYNWTLPSGWTQTAGGTTNSITVTAGSTVANITVTPSNNCGTGTARGYTISSVGTPAVINTQPSDITVCTDATASISASVSSASSLQWQYSTDQNTWLSASNGTYGVSGATTSSISLANPVTNEWYGYFFRLTANGTGCGATYSNIVEVTGGNPTITLAGTPSSIYSQGFGTTTTSTLPTGFTTYGVPSSGTVFTLSTVAASGGQYTGATGGANALLTGNSGNAGKRVYLETPAIITTGKTNITVIWAVRQSSSYVGTQLVEYSTNGSTWTAIPYLYTSQYYGDNWVLENDDLAIQLPADASNITTLKLRISTPVHATGTFRIDDLLVQGVDMTTPAASVCSGSSLNLPYSDVSIDADKYSVTVSPAIPGFSVVDATLTASPISIAVPANTTAGDYTFSVTVKNSATGCTSLAEQNYLVHVNKVTATASNTGAYYPTQTISLSSSATGATGTLGYSWSGPSTFTAAVANPTRANAQASYAGAYTVTITDAGTTCSATASTTVVVNAAPTVYTWTGTVNTDWSIAGNWDVAVAPNDCNHNVIVPSNPPSGNYPAIDVLVSVGNINLGNGARITLNDNLNVCGNWTGGATTASILLGTGTVVLQGTATQTISGKTQFNTLQANNATGGVQVQGGSAVEIFNALQLKAGNFNAGTNLVTFRSISTTEAGIIDNFSAGFSGTLSGTIKAQRYYDSPAAISFSQHFMGSPVDAPAVTQFGATGVPGQVQPLNCWIDSFAAGSPYGTMYEYIEANGSGCGVKVWTSLTSGNTVNGKGYSVARSGAGTLTVSGTANLNSSYAVSGLGNSNYNNSVSYVQTAPFTTVNITSGWHLVANPYLANLNITTHAANSAFDAQIQVWEATGPYAGTYRARMTNTNAVLAPFQAVLVHKTAVGDSASYNLYASDRTLNNATFYRQANQSELKLVAENLTTGLLDETFVAFNSDATAQFDPIYDANKVQGSNTRHTIYSVVNATDYAINTLTDVEHTSTVPVSMRPGADASFKFTVEGINSFDPTQYIYLEDKVTGQMIDLRQNPEYTFSMTTAEAFDRFVLHFTPAATMQATNATCEAQGTIALAQPGTASWNYTVTDANNATISSGTLNEANPVTVHAATGVYTVTLVDANNYTVARNVMVSGANAADATFSTSATTVEEGNDVAFTANQAGATYTWNLGNGATATGSGVTMAYLTPGVYTVELTVTTAGGCTATSTQLVTVTEKVTTGIKDVTEAGIKLWSNTNKVYVDFGKAKLNNASVSIFNLLGQELAKDAVSGTIYVREVTQIEAGYVLVRVENNGTITTKKLLITNK